MNEKLLLATPYIRHALQALAGVLLMKGYLSYEAQEIFVALGLNGITAIWMFYEKKKTK